MQRRLYIDEAHTALDIFSFAVFFLYILYIYNIGQCLKNDQDNVLYDIKIMSNNLRQYLKKGHHLKKSEKNLKILENIR